jgi:hypothetical protein
MYGLLLAFFLVQASPQNSGTVTGVVRGANGMPAPGVRVYAMAVRDAAQPVNAGTAFESLAQTDAGGRYRIAVPAGQYYIASGSVGTPTYYSGATNVTDARVIAVIAGGLVENIDFAGFVARAPDWSGGPNPPPLPPGSTGVLQGVIRFPDGAPAPSITVVAIPTGALARTTTAAGTVTVSFATNTLGATSTRWVINGYNILRGFTDANGRYRMENVPPETYYIAAGFADEPIFFPGTPDSLVAKTFTTTPTTLLDTLDFSLSPVPVGVSIKGRVRDALGGAPAAGTTVVLGRAIIRGIGLSNRPTSTSVTLRADGTFETPPLLPGDYLVRSFAADGRTNTSTQNLTLGNQPVSGLELVVPVRVP